MSELRDAAATPLHGKRVLVTRALHQAAELSNRLRALGAVPVELPTIEIVPLEGGGLDSALATMDSYDWIVFTSVNAVTVVADRLPAGDLPSIAAVGDATATALMARGLQVQFIPDEFVGEAVLEGLVASEVAGKRILLPRADIGRSVLPDGLRQAGAIVDDVPAYSTRAPQEVNESILTMIRSGEIDIITFTSPSTVRNLLAMLDGKVPATTKIACIGPISARAAREAGLRVDITASEYSIPGLVRALAESEDNEHS